MYYINLKFVSVTLNTYWTTIYLPTIIFFLISHTSFWLYLDARWDVYILGKIIKSHFENRNFITNGMCLGNPHVHIRKNFSSFFFFPHPLSCLHAMLGWKYTWNFFVLFIFREKAKKYYSHDSLKNFIVHHYNFNQNTSKIGIFKEKGPKKYSKDIHEDINFSILLPYLSHCKNKRTKKAKHIW